MAAHAKMAILFASLMTCAALVSVDTCETQPVQDTSLMQVAAVKKEGAFTNASGDKSRAVWPQVPLVGGWEFTAILKDDGSLWTAGLNNVGQLCDGTWDQRSVLQQVGTGIQSVAAGWYHLAVLKSDSTAWTCGGNSAGQMGAGGTSHSSVFRKVASGVQFVSAQGVKTAYIKEDGSLWTTGSNSYGELGNGDTSQRDVFGKVLDNVSAVSSGNHHTIVIKTDGSLMATGKNDDYELLDGTKTHRTSFAPIQQSDAFRGKVKALKAARLYNAILTEDGKFYTGGDNYYGTLLDGTKTDRGSLIQITSDVQSIGGGYTTNLVLKTDGSLWAGGHNNHGSSGDGTKTEILSFKEIDQISDVVAIGETDGFQSLVMKRDGSVWAVGWNNGGQQANGDKGDDVLQWHEIANIHVPTPAPTSAPTPAATPAPTTTPAAPAQNPSGVGDPHLRNVLGQRFDLMQPGSHMLMNIPQGTTAQEDALFRVMARADRIGGHCADMYFEALNVTGQWVEASALGLGGLHFSADSDIGSVNDDYMARWLKFGPVHLKVVRGHLHDGTAYLNVFFKNIMNTGYPVGGLLGEDDHKKEATPNALCKQVTNLKAVHQNAAVGSIAQVKELDISHGSTSQTMTGSIAQVLPE